MTGLVVSEGLYKAYAKLSPRFNVTPAMHSWTGKTPAGTAPGLIRSPDDLGELNPLNHEQHFLQISFVFKLFLCELNLPDTYWLPKKTPWCSFANPAYNGCASARKPNPTASLWIVSAHAKRLISDSVGVFHWMSKVLNSWLSRFCL